MISSIVKRELIPKLTKKEKVKQLAVKKPVEPLPPLKDAVPIPESTITIDGKPIDTGEYRAKEYPPSEFFLHWREYWKDRTALMRPNSIRMILNEWDRFKLYFQKRPVGPSTVRDFCRWYLFEKKWATSMYALLLTDYNYYIDFLSKRNIVVNPKEMSEAYKPMPVVKKKKPIVTEEEYERLRKASFGSPFYYFFTLLWTYGMRKGDAVYLTWEQVDMETKTIRFVPWKTKRKNSKPVELPFTEEMEKFFIAMKQDPDNKKYVCNHLARSGHARAPELASQMVGYYVRKAKIGRPIGPHMFRHTRATRMLNAANPVDIFTASDVLGICTETLKTYVRISPENKKKAIEA